MLFVKKAISIESDEGSMQFLWVLLRTPNQRMSLTHC